MSAEATAPDAVIPAKAGIHSDAPSSRHSRESGSPVSFARYPKYKDSGAVWLGEVPAHWGVMKLKWIAHLRSGETIGPDQIDDSGEFPVFGGNGLRGYTTAYTHEGDYALVGRQGALCGNINYASGKFWASEHAVVATPGNGVCTRWLGELLRSMDLNQYSTSAAQPGLSVDVISNLVVAAPPGDEQQAIAAFLDRETTKIDALIAEQEKLIALLKEKRQALISHAVTKGLDPNAPMKDSGIEWLGQVPAHWDVARLGTIFREVSDVGAEDLPILSVSIHDGISDKELDEAEMDRKVTRSEDRSKYKAVQPGDLAYNMMRAWQGGFGAVTVTGQISPAYVVARPMAEVCTSFIEQLLRTPQAVEQMRRHSRGVTDFRLRLYWEEFKNIRVALPPLREQQAILDAAAIETAKFDSLVGEAQGTIELLKERRTALVSAAVTGKIYVLDS